MAKKIVGFIKLQVPAGKANPSPPIGPALGQRGLNIMEFCKAFNAQTQGMEPGLVLPVVITAFADKSFTFVLKTPPASVLIKKALKLEKGSAKPHLDKVGKLTRAQIEFAEEVGLEPKGPYLPLGTIKQKGGKIVHAWAVEGDLPPDFVQCSNTFRLEWPPRSGRIQPFPEIDKAAWTPLTEARSKLVKAQHPLLDHLLATTV